MIVVDQVAALPTPALLLDERRMLANVARLRERAAGLGVRLRPHLKTAKSVDVARRLLDGGAGPATVSTLREAEVFFQAGVRDILYAVGIAPRKLPPSGCTPGCWLRLDRDPRHNRASRRA